jgi:hypothetical protein
LQCVANYHLIKEVPLEGKPMKVEPLEEKQEINIRNTKIFEELKQKILDYVTDHVVFDYDFPNDDDSQCVDNEELIERFGSKYTLDLIDQAAKQLIRNGSLVQYLDNPDAYTTQSVINDVDRWQEKQESDREKKEELEREKERKKKEKVDPQDKEDLEGAIEDFDHWSYTLLNLVEDNTSPRFLRDLVDDSKENAFRAFVEDLEFRMTRSLERSPQEIDQIKKRYNLTYKRDKQNNTDLMGEFDKYIVNRIESLAQNFTNPDQLQEQLEEYRDY